MECFGYIIKNRGVKINPGKIRAIMKWLTLRNVFEVLFFLGFINFYRRFIKGYLKIILSLTNLIKKDIMWTWNNHIKWAFQELKKRFSNKLVLR